MSPFLEYSNQTLWNKKRKIIYYTLMHCFLKINKGNTILKLHLEP